MLCRAWRAVSNCLQAPHSCITLLHMQGLAGLLGKAFTRQDGDALAQVLVRCARLAGETSQHKAMLLQDVASLPPVLPVFNFRFHIIIITIIIIEIVISMIIANSMSPSPTSPSSKSSLLQDPYCGWNIVSSKCVSHNTFNSM